MLIYPKYYPSSILTECKFIPSQDVRPFHEDFSKKKRNRIAFSPSSPFAGVKLIAREPGRTKSVRGGGGGGAIGDPRPADWTVFYCHRARKIDPGRRTILSSGERGHAEAGGGKEACWEKACGQRGGFAVENQSPVRSCKQG